MAGHRCILCVPETAAGLFPDDRAGVGSWSYSVDIARSITAAAGRLNTEETDCVVVDGRTLGEDTHGAIETLRVRRPELPIVVCVDGVDTSLAEDVVSAGATDVLQVHEGPPSSVVVTNRIEGAIERHRDEASVESVEYRYQRLVEDSTGAIAVIDDYGRFSYLSPTAENVFGHRPADLRDEYVLEYVHPEDRAVIEDRFETLVETPDGRVEAELRFETADGYRWIAARGRNLRDDPYVQGIVTNARDITERKRRERELKLFETFVETVNDGIYALDMDGRFTFVNSQIEAVTGYDAEELIGEHPTKLISEAQTEELEPAVQEMLAGDRETLVEEFQIERADGGSVPVEVSITPLVVDGEFEGTVGVARNVSERRARVAALRRLHDATQALINADSKQEAADIATEATETIADDPIGAAWVYDPAGDALRPIASTERTTELLDEIPTFDGEGSLAWDAYRTGSMGIYDDLDDVPGTYNPDTPIRSELVLPVGEYGAFAVGSIEPANFDEFDTMLASLLAEALEVSFAWLEREGELQDNRAELQQENVRIEALHTVATEMKTVDDRSKIYDLVVEAAEDVLDFNHSILDEIEDDTLIPKVVSSGMSLEDYYSETPIDAENNLGAETYRLGETFVIDDLHEAGYGPANFEYSSALSVPLGEWGLFQAVAEKRGAFDEVDRQMAELLVAHANAAVNRLERQQALEERARRLKRQNQQLDRFASIVSHDLRNPISVVQGRVRLARSGGKDEHLDAIETQLDRMEGLIDGLLTLVREGNSAADRTETDVARIAEATWEHIDSERVSLELDSPPVLRIDRQHLAQMLTNLFNNSVDHGGDLSTVTVGTLNEGFYVADDGDGIPEQTRSDIFTFGYSGDGGTGVGLATVETLAEANGYAVTATASETGGARFEFTGGQDESHGA